MAASERGLRFSGGIADKRNGMSVFFLSEIDSAGEILFEYRETTATLEADHGYISNSIIDSERGCHYAVIKNGVTESLLEEEHLVCFNEKEEKLWEVDLPESFYSNDLAVSDECAYIVGAERVRDKYGCLVNQRSTLFCYHKSGTLLWQHHCTTVESFSFAVPDKQSCYAISSVINSQADALYSNESIGTQDAVLL